MISAQTDGIQVSVEVFYYPEGSDPQNRQFLFAYQITIHNQTPNTVQLLRRHWHIWDADGSKREVEGEGVVGEQPILEPDASYQYMSACNLHTEFGHMNGSFLMLRKKDKHRFWVEIPDFNMAVPHLLN